MFLCLDIILMSLPVLDAVCWHAAACHVGYHLLASTHCAYPLRDGQAELAWVAGYICR